MFPWTDIQTMPEFEHWVFWSIEPELLAFGKSQESGSGLPPGVAEWVVTQLRALDAHARGWGNFYGAEAASIPGIYHCAIVVH